MSVSLRDAWRGINALCVLRTLTKTQGRTAYMADLPYPMGNTTKPVSFPETNDTIAFFCLDFNSSNADGFLVVSERALSTDEEEYFVSILITNNRRFITNKLARMA